MTIAIERELQEGSLDFNGNGIAGCAICGWRGVSPLVKGVRSTVCPACSIEETRYRSSATSCADCGGLCVEQLAGGRRWRELEQGELYRPGAVVVPITRAQKVGRNEPCSCGSGRKFKKCCGAAA